ncbi:MAG: hypothetical protein ACRDKB_11270 [Actinomycetota bacterium]
MRTKTWLSIALAVLVAATLLSPASFAQGKKKGKKKSGPVVVGKDAAGDWGANVDPALAPLGDVLGQDLVEATVAMDGKDTVNFVFKLNALPPTGGVPEFSRYIWGMEIDGNYLEIDGKFTNYSRGACDPTSGQCPPPRDPGTSPFLVRGNCTTTQNITTCEELGVVQATFDGGAGTITVPLTFELMGAKPGSKITPVMSDFTSLLGGAIATIPSAFISNTAMPADAIQATGVFVVPRGKK